jgi:hypothetical protein
VRVGVVGLLPRQEQALRAMVAPSIELVFTRKDSLRVSALARVERVFMMRFVSHEVVRRVRLLDVPITQILGGLSELSRRIEEEVCTSTSTA